MNFNMSIPDMIGTIESSGMSFFLFQLCVSLRWNGPLPLVSTSNIPN